METAYRFNTRIRCIVFLCWIGLFITGLGHAITYTYDDLSRLIKVEYDDGSKIEYTYDEAGNILLQAHTKAPPLPVATITATDPHASEAGPDTGTFTVSRTGSTESGLVVNYTVSGTATAGVDYNSLPGTVTIPAGSPSAAIFVTPKDDTDAEDNETVIVTLSGGSFYTVGSPSSATVTIAEHIVAPKPNLTPYQPEGWSNKIVVANKTGTITDDTPLYTTDTLYVDLAIKNIGLGATAGNFYLELYLDGTLQKRWTVSDVLGPEAHLTIQDYSIGSLGVGTHTLRIVVDATGVIDESSESDNEYTRTIAVSSPPAPGKATLVSPSGTISNNTPAYSWNAVPNSAWYYLWVSDSTGTKISSWYSATQAGCSSGSGTCSISPNAVLAIGPANWWVQTWNSNGYGPWSDAMPFTVPAPVLPGKATLVSPLQITTFNNWPDFTWNAASNAAWYLLWVDDNTGNRINTWYSAATNCSGETCFASPGISLAEGSVKWWVQSWSPNGYGPWSDAGTFTAPAPVLPGKATLISPSGNASTTSPAYSWKADLYATWYYLWVNDSTGTKIQKWFTGADAGCADGTGSCAVTTDIALAAGSGKWWINTWNPNGSGPWSDAGTFSINPSGGGAIQ